MPSDPGTPPVFVGGSGRSGTTIAGELIGASAHYALVPIELRFHVDGGGLAQLARGETSLDAFQTAMTRKWYQRPPAASGASRGVQVVIDRPELEQAFGRLRDTYPQDPWRSCGTFLEDVVDPLRRTQGAASWVEMTPPNAKAIHTLSRMLPTAQFVHMVRDGRDVAHSVARRSWGPDDVPGALIWWGKQMLAIHRSISDSDASRVHTVRLESLVGPHREVAYDQLADFLGLQGDATMRTFFDERMSTGRARPGSWQRGLDPDEAERVELLYRKQLARLESQGVSFPSVL
ncbi:MAG: sulfotransferase family protein [Ornithinimicrobium sp.]|uniref:sulfotransferase family protein n=1 Tax=Ornithinimicrobium sp. TaxID=1977084 RepID=UPI003D9BC8B4